MIQKQYTYEYSQPNEYHFSLDSIEMPLKVANLYEGKDLTRFKVLDLCSGCGVIGFEFHFYLPEIMELHSLEIQESSYRTHYEMNLQKIKTSATRFEPHWSNYTKLQESQFGDMFDLILCNPPYFEPDQGKMSPFEFKNRCRFFLDSDFESLIEGILFSLKPTGSAYLLLRPLKEHKKDLKAKLEQIVNSRAHCQTIDFIRGTELIQIQKSQHK